MKKLFFLLFPVVILILAFKTDRDHTIKGFVRDVNGNALAGVSIRYVGASIVTTSGKDGSYSISVPSLKGELAFTSVGFSELIIPIKGLTKLDVVLHELQQDLQEVVVVGYGAEKKKAYTGNAQVQASAMNRSLQGRAPGLQVSNGYYNPGTPIIRGTSNNNQNRSWVMKDTVGLDFDTEGYDAIIENPFNRPSAHPLSTFSIDVDAASYSNMRRFLSLGQMPPAGSVRIEEMINYFTYDYAQPTGEHPFSIHTEMSDAPWNPKHKLVLIGLQGKKIPVENLPASNLVFLIDVSGSMSDDNKLPLVKSSLRMLVAQLRPQDKVSIVVYAGAAGVMLNPTSGDEKKTITDVIDKLEAGGYTAGGEGLRKAYSLARQSFVKGGNNRVILCSDGDFNVGESSDAAMEKLIEKERESGVFLTVLGYGMGNYKDNKMQKLANKGNGNHAYIDGITEAKKVLVNEFGGTLFTIAKDVKLQIEFNPKQVAGYRLIGYENRMLASEDFNDDKKDAGELGSGHTVTALYEIIPAGVASDFLRDVDPLKYQANPPIPNAFSSETNEWMTIKFRYKNPDGDKSLLLEHVVKQQPIALGKTSDNFRFAAAVAEMGMLLRSSAFKGEANFDQVIRLAKGARGQDEEGYRAEFIRLVESAGSMVGNK